MIAIPRRYKAAHRRKSWLATRLTDNRRVELIIVLAGTFMALLDITIVNVALPTMQRSLHAGPDTLEWIVSAYALAFGITLIPAGRLGDAYGRKRLFVIGMLVFTLCSTCCAVAANAQQLITARVGQGIGAGIFLPQISAVIQALFSGRARAKAFGYMGSVVGMSTALGPLAGGALVEFANWRWVFLINIPIGLFTLIAAMALLRETERHAQHVSLDPLGVILLTAILLLLEVPLTEGHLHGWPLWTLVCFTAVAPTTLVFGWWEKHQAHHERAPIIPLNMLKDRTFLAGCILGLCYFASFTSMLFCISVTWQEGFQHSALRTGLTLLPFPLGGMIFAATSARLTHWLGRNVILLGVTLVFMGFFAIIALLAAEGSFIQTRSLIPPLLLAGCGNGLITGPSLTFILTNVPKHLAGVAGAITQTAQRVGSAIGISVAGTLLFATVNTTTGNARREAFRMGFEITAAVNLLFLLCVFLAATKLPRHAQEMTKPNMVTASDDPEPVLVPAE